MPINQMQDVAKEKSSQNSNIYNTPFSHNDATCETKQTFSSILSVGGFAFDYYVDYIFVDSRAEFLCD